MKTTEEAARKRKNRARAWDLLARMTPGVRCLPRHDSGSPAPLMDIARDYDRICRRAEGLLKPDATEAEILAALLVVRMLREKLDHDELKLTSLARAKRITWATIAEWQELSGRQAAERRHLQLSRAYTHPDGTAPATQSERVELARSQRGRRAERHWALKNAARIRLAAAQLAAVEDLQKRVDNSREAHILNALDHSDLSAEKPTPAPLVWPTALRECVAEAERLHDTPRPPADDSLHSPSNLRQQQEADIAHRLLGLIGYAANPRNIDLSDLPALAHTIREIHNDCRHAAQVRRAGHTAR